MDTVAAKVVVVVIVVSVETVLVTEEMIRRSRSSYDCTYLWSWRWSQMWPSRYRY